MPPRDQPGRSSLTILVSASISRITSHRAVQPEAVSQGVRGRLLRAGGAGRAAGTRVQVSVPSLQLSLKSNVFFRIQR